MIKRCDTIGMKFNWKRVIVSIFKLLHKWEMWFTGSIKYKIQSIHAFVWLFLCIHISLITSNYEGSKLLLLTHA